ncbi:MAG TPA: endonuclease III [Polyangiaceae bacterium]
MKKAEAAAGQRPTRKAAREAFSATFRELRRAHPDAHCELDHKTPFELVVATVLSAQSTDVAVNKVTPELFRRFPTPQELALAEPSTVEALLGKLGMFRQKTKSLIGLSKKLVSDHAGSVPDTLAELITLPGVGRKTANVVLGVAFNKPEGVVVDTHVQRISQRLGWTDHATPDKIEPDLMQLAHRRHWDILSHTLIFHGRRVCTAMRPACISCAVNKRCPSAFQAEAVGRKPPRLRGGPAPSAKARPKPAAKPKKRPQKLMKQRPGRNVEPGLKAGKRSLKKPERSPR